MRVGDWVTANNQEMKSEWPMVEGRRRDKEELGVKKSWGNDSKVGSAYCLNKMPIAHNLHT